MGIPIHVRMVADVLGESGSTRRTVCRHSRAGTQGTQGRGTESSSVCIRYCSVSRTDGSGRWAAHPAHPSSLTPFIRVQLCW